MKKYSKHKFGKEAREALLNGAEQVYRAVSTTLGPRGRNVVLWKDYDTQIQHDGVTVAQEINPKDPYQNAGAAIIKQAAQQQVSKVGDGTSVAIVLGYAIAKEALKIIEAGVNPMALRAGLEAGRDILTGKVQELSVPVKTKKQKIQIATISAEDKELGKIIGETLHETGEDGVVTVDDVLGVDTYIDHQEGLQIDSGYATNYFVTNPRTMTATIKNVKILVTDHKLTDVHEMIPMFKNVVEEHSQKNLMIVATDIEGTVLATLVQNKLNGNMNTLAVKVPQYGGKDLLQDIATVVGAKFISAEAKMKMEDVTIDDLGSADEVKASDEATVVIGGAGDSELVQERIDSIKGQLEEDIGEFNKEKLRERLARITGGVYVVNVGGSTEVEAREKKERAIDAVMATKAAMKEGVVPGGETIYMPISQDMNPKDENEEYAFRILKEALKLPFHRLVENAGLNSGAMLAKLEKEPLGFGVDVTTGEIKDLMKSGIIDPALVSIEAINNAVSVATAIITSDAIIIEKNEKVSKVQPQ